MRWFHRGCLAAGFFIIAVLSSCGGDVVVRKPPPGEERIGPPVVTPLRRAPIVRVLVLEAKNTVRVSTTSAFFMGEGSDTTPLRRFEGRESFIVGYSRGEVKLTQGKKTIHEAPSISIRPVSESNVYINGKPYRGGFLFRAEHGGVITINVVDVDDYIKGVLPVEIGYLTVNQYEAYLVQAITSRTYAISKLEEKKAEIYDVKATIMDQVYRGVQGEHPDASRAVDETRGLVCMWRGEPARTYYCSCCGGYTADIRVSWPWKTPYPYLYGKRDSGEGEDGKSFCRRSPNFRWRVHWSGNELRKTLRKNLTKELGIRPAAVGAITDLKVLGTAADGRVNAIEIVTDRGSYRVDGDRIRWVLRPSGSSDAILKSTLFKMSVKKARGKVLSVNLVGGGNGHGVGMCQTGAIRMAEEGYSAEEILKHYYPGITIYSYYR